MNNTPLNQTNSFISTSQPSDGFFGVKSNYNRLKGMLTDLGTFTSDTSVSLDKESFNDGSVIANIPAPTTDRIRKYFSEASVLDDNYRDSCAMSRQMNDVKVQANRQIEGVQKVNVENSSITSKNEEIITAIMLFFKELNIQMQSMRKTKTPSRDNTDIKGKTNISVNMVATLTNEILAILKKAINSGFTVIGIIIIRDFNITDINKTKKEDEESTLTLHNKELEELKSLRKEMLTMSLEDQKKVVQEKGFAMKMKPFTEHGFTTTSSLLVFLGILYTIVEFTLIMFYVLNN